ncbi:MAG: CRTAC1 family protein [Saprospiraceae bacterium]|nr:CRTAC1 family protein [Saprospiraceae bacterium]
MINLQLHKNFTFSAFRKNKNYCILLILWMIMSHHAYPQTLFQKISQGPVVNTISDSRSVNLVDVNNDGLDDLFISNGPSSGAEDYLYINQGNFQFYKDTLFFKSLILPSVGACIGDIHNNGDRTIYVSSWYNRSNVLYIKNAMGQYNGSPTSYKTYSESAAWGDYDQDGWLDLYVSNAGNGPADNRNLLFRNDGKGNLTPVLNHISTSETLYSRGVSWVDFDNDGDADLFVCNENKSVNSLFRNDGNGMLVKMDQAGDLLKDKESSMSASWADVNNDGWLDVFVCHSNNFIPASSALYINQKNGSFSAIRQPFASDPGCSFSASFADYDNDGDLDLAVSNGFCNTEMYNVLYLNDGFGNFTKDDHSIQDLSTPCSFGLAWSDLDQNGFQDLVISTCKNSSQAVLPNNMVFQNKGNSNHWIRFDLKGNKSNKDAIGARINISSKVDGKQLIQSREISSQSGYCSQNSLKAHFGLKDGTKVDTVWIQWPSGIQQKMFNLPSDLEKIIVEPNISSTLETSKNELRINPNPAQGVVRIYFPQNVFKTYCKIEIIHQNGQLLFSRNQILTDHSEWFELDTTALQLPPGSYTLSLQSENQHISKEMVLIR